ncbi:hypothetical protein V5N11_017607 [Cardamine amara subsp. amara]|uniref:DUF4283 domain-containing protein n=1 Tax=Cardamine amara subsp. amara TaxID=228776 RepID=A0ABD1A0F8_CARAN
MSFELDRALQKMSIEEDKPIKLRTIPRACARERNVCNIMGRLLNPDNQKMSSLIHDMPRLWKINNKCRGFALSQDRFQFVFDSETDLATVLEAGAWTYDDWSMTLERYDEKPHEDYL